MAKTKHKGEGKNSSNHPLKVGSIVHIARLKKIGIISEVMSESRFRVCVGSLAFTCKASELTVDTAKQVLSSKPAPMKLPNVPPPPQTLDLHGQTVDEAVRMLELWLDRAILAGLSRVKVIHGFGSGKVQKAVHQHLAGLSSVVGFKLNQFNPGETDIFL